MADKLISKRFKALKEVFVESTSIEIWFYRKSKQKSDQKNMKREKKKNIFRGNRNEFDKRNEVFLEV